MVNASPRNCDRFSQGSWWRSYGVRLVVSPSREDLPYRGSVPRIGISYSPMLQTNTIEPSKAPSPPQEHGRKSPRSKRRTINILY